MQSHLVLVNRILIHHGMFDQRVSVRWKKDGPFYTSNSGLIELRQEICKWYQRKYNVLYDYKTEALLTVGGSEGIDVALRAMLDPGDEVIIPEPCYVSYVPCVQLIGAVPVTIELKNENQVPPDTGRTDCSDYG